MKTWNLKTGKYIRELLGIKFETSLMCEILSEKILTYLADHYFRFWDLGNGNLIKKFYSKEYTVTCLIKNFRKGIDKKFQNFFNRWIKIFQWQEIFLIHFNNNFVVNFKLTLFLGCQNGKMLPVI